MPHPEDPARRAVAFLMPDRTFASVFDAPDVARLIAEPSLELLSPEPLDPRDLADRELLSRAEIVITGWGTPVIEGEMRGALPALAAVSHAAGTVRPVVTDALLDEGVAVASAAGANAVPVAEFAFAMVVLAAKRVLWAEEGYRASGRQPDARAAWPWIGSHGIRVGVVGASHVGQLVIERLGSLDVEVVVSDPTLDADQRRALGAEVVPLEELVATSDVVTLHAPSLPSTRGMIGREAIASMKPGAALINTARGELVDEEALADRLEAGDIAAFLDVTAREPLPAGDRLWSAPNTLLTPHLAGSVGNENGRLAAHAVDEAIRFARTGAFADAITPRRMAVIA
ncbi:hydroxyacid dehydrogenase [Microbacterium indicum]|uniref:hydroxyacid dehydrogenase n=1 Tax=Microbacterium indicum TaxID=358100 RepID=UPI00042683CD|nr:hydroxyacid dehydrogenase [Microbacterium indicum]